MVSDEKEEFDPFIAVIVKPSKRSTHNLIKISLNVPLYMKVDLRDNLSQKFDELKDILKQSIDALKLDMDDDSDRH